MESIQQVDRSWVNGSTNRRKARNRTPTWSQPNFILRVTLTVTVRCDMLVVGLAHRTTAVHWLRAQSPSHFLMKSDIQYSTMSPVLPFDVIALIIDIVGENNDTDILKELALVAHSFHQICIKHLFANVDLHDAKPKYHLVSSKKGFVKLVKSRPNVVNYIRKLTYKVSGDNDDHLLSPALSPILSNFLPTTSRLNCFEINASDWGWDQLDSSLTSAFLHLISLPTINHIGFSNIGNFPFSSLTLSVNLLRLDMTFLTCLDYSDEDIYFKTVQSEMLPKIREFHTWILQIPTCWRWSC